MFKLLLLSYVIYRQFWLNLPMSDCHFGYVKKLFSNLFWLMQKKKRRFISDLALSSSHNHCFFFPQICEVGGFVCDHLQEDLAKFGNKFKSKLEKYRIPFFFFLNLWHVRTYFQKYGNFRLFFSPSYHNVTNWAHLFSENNPLFFHTYIFWVTKMGKFSPHPQKHTHTLFTIGCN
jgi:hypothetical protein